MYKHWVQKSVNIKYLFFRSFQFRSITNDCFFFQIINRKAEILCEVELLTFVVFNPFCDVPRYG